MFTLRSFSVELEFTVNSAPEMFEPAAKAAQMRTVTCR
jgi:hypothetical protein